MPTALTSVTEIDHISAGIDGDISHLDNQGVANDRAAQAVVLPSCHDRREKVAATIGLRASLGRD